MTTAVVTVGVAADGEAVLETVPDNKPPGPASDGNDAEQGETTCCASVPFKFLILA